MPAIRTSRSSRRPDSGTVDVDKLTFAEYRARRSGSTVNKKSTTTAAAAAATNPTTTIPSPPRARSPDWSRLASPPASPSPDPTRPAAPSTAVDTNRVTVFAADLEVRNTKREGAPLETRHLVLANPLVPSKPKPKRPAATAAIMSPPETRSPTPAAAVAGKSSPAPAYDDLFEEPPPPPPPSKEAVQAAKQARREAALARSSKTTTVGSVASTRAALVRIDKSASSASRSGAIKKRPRGGPRPSAIRKLAGTSGRWVDPETEATVSSAQVEASSAVRRHLEKEQQQHRTPLEARVAARRAAEKEQHRRQADELLAQAPNNRDGSCVAVLGDALVTVGFGAGYKGRRRDANPMWTTNAATFRGQGGLRY
ncbi:hypothetical protein IWX47DRAFT_848308 [Phyllosticta citricarpa]